MSETCNSRTLTWLVKSCLPETRRETTFGARISDRTLLENLSSISSLPDDLLLECLSRVSPSSLSSLPLVSRKWSQTVTSPAFYNLRRTLGRLTHTIYAVSVSDYGVLYATYRIGKNQAAWETPDFPETVTRDIFSGSFSHVRVLAIGREIYIAGRNVFRYDTWTETVTERSRMLFPRKKFAAAAIAGKIYVAGGTARTAAVEEYDPESDTWRVVADSPMKRYGCVGAAVDGVFYVIGGLRISTRAEMTSLDGRLEWHVYGSMDLFDVRAHVWLRSRAVPGGGCIVAACAAGGHVYVLASHALDLSFWRFDGRRKSVGFGGWCRIKSPPLPAQVRLDGALRFCCIGVGERVVLVQVKEGWVLAYDSVVGEWSRWPDLPETFRRSACLCVEC